MLYRPEYVLFLGIIFYALILSVSPINLLVPIELDSLGFIFITSISFSLGSRFADFAPLAARLQAERKFISSARIVRIETRLFWLSMSLGASGNILRLIDKYILRGVGDLTGFAAREMLIDTSASSLSVIGGILYPFGYLPLFILLGANGVRRTPWRTAIAAFIFLIPALDALVLLSRSFMLVSLAMAYFATSITLFRGKLVPRRLIIPVLTGIIVVSTISIQVFASRLDEMSLAISQSMVRSGYAFTVSPNADVLAAIRSGGLYGKILEGVVPIIQYYVHSIPEFQILWNAHDYQQFSGGSLHFAPFVKLLSLLSLAAEPDLGMLFPRVGVFTSFWGPLWVDFGWFAPLVMFIFGFAARRIALGAFQSDLGAYPLYTYICVILFFAPVVNFAISAQGMYVITAFYIFWLFTRRLPRGRSAH